MKVTFLLILIFTGELFATAQSSDKILFRGNEYRLFTNPLEAYFFKYPGTRPESRVFSTGLWRGYVATFEIKDNQLLLKDIEIEVLKDTVNDSFDTEWKSIIAEFFPDQESIKIDWFTGLLVIPYGELVNYVHCGYSSLYKNYILLEIKQGELKKEINFTSDQYEEFRERQFQEFKKTDEYRKRIEEYKERGQFDEESTEEFLKDCMIDYTTKILIDPQEVISIEEDYTPSLAGLMAEVNDPTSVYNNPAALGFLSVDRKFQINLFVDLETSIKIDRSPPDRVGSYSFPQIIMDENSFISLYIFGFYFAIKSQDFTSFPVIARRFGRFAAGFELRDNSLDMGTLLVINDKFRVSLSGVLSYEPRQLHGRGGIVYQPLDWYYFGVDVFPDARRFRLVNAFLNHKFGIDNLNLGLQIDARNEDLKLDAFIQGVFSFKYLQFAVGLNSGIIKYSPYSSSGTFGFDIICSSNFGF